MQNEHDTYIKPTTIDVDIYISKKKYGKTQEQDACATMSNYWCIK